MNETNELFCEIGASDAVALANAKGWDDETLAAELGSGILAALRRCVACDCWHAKKTECCGGECARELTKKRMMAISVAQATQIIQRRLGWKQNLQAKIF